MANFKAKNCPKCGNIYIDTGRHMCADCYHAVQLIETEVCAFIRDNPEATTEEIMEATGATTSIIRRMARDGFFESGSVSYPCKKCGKPIVVGVMCSNCMGKIRKNLKVSMNAIDARKKIIQHINGTDVKATYKTIDKK